MTRYCAGFLAQKLSGSVARASARTNGE